MSHQLQRLRIANRIHLVLLRHLDQGIDVGRMLREGAYAHDVLLVCDSMHAQGLEGLSGLAAQFRATDVLVPPRHAKVWLQDSAAEVRAGQRTVALRDLGPSSGSEIDIDLSDFEPRAKVPATPRRPWLWQPAARWLAA